jgi:Domain of unknown function (DUF1835)/Protein of unknown function
MFHIVFDSQGAKQIAEAMDLDEALDGEIIQMTDDYSVGPIQDLFSVAGWEARAGWWASIREEEVPAEEESDAERLRKLQLRMDEEEFDQIWIWVAPNVRDVTGYYWLITQLQAFSGRIFVISLNNLPFIGEKGNVFYPTALSEILPREFVKAKRLARPVSPAEFETDPDEWLRLAAENKNLRVLEGGKKLGQQADDYFDRSILHFLQPNFQKIPRMLQQFLLKSPEKLNESFLLWRLKQLVASGAAEQQGETIRLFVNTADQELSAS